MHRCSLRWEETRCLSSLPTQEGRAPVGSSEGSRTSGSHSGRVLWSPGLPRENQGKVNHRATSLGSSYRPARQTRLCARVSFLLGQ